MIFPFRFLFGLILVGGSFSACPVLAITWTVQAFEKTLEPDLRTLLSKLKMCVEQTNKVDISSYHRCAGRYMDPDLSEREREQTGAWFFLPGELISLKSCEDESQTGGRPGAVGTSSVVEAKAFCYRVKVQFGEGEKQAAGALLVKRKNRKLYLHSISRPRPL